MPKHKNEIIPTVIEKNAQGDRAYDIYSRLLKDRIIFIQGGIDDSKSSTVIAQLLFLEKEDKDEEIKIYIMSQGGSVLAAFAIYDTIQLINAPVATFCIGYAYSAAAFLLAAGSKGRRVALPTSKIMIHEPWVGHIEGKTEDVKIEAQQLELTKQLFLQRMSSHTGKSADQIEKDCMYDKYFSPEEAKKYGIVDKVLNKNKK